MCYLCEREEAERAAAEAAAKAALKAAEPKRTLLVSEILRGDPCYTYSSKLIRFTEGTIEVSVSLAVEQAADWDWYWAASHLLTEAGYDKFAEQAREAAVQERNLRAPYQDLFDKASDGAMGAYNRAKDKVLNESGDYNRAYEEADKVYEEATILQRTALNAVRELTDKRLNEAYAKSFAEIYISEEGTEDKTGNDRYYGNDSDEYEDDYEEDDDY